VAEKGKKRGNCPRCGSGMKLKRRYCTSCGCPNPLLAAPRRRPAAPAAKAAGSSYAPVLNLRPAVPARDPKWAAVLADPDPNGRERLLRAYFPQFTDGGGAA
jgi:hypothetical protein